MYADHRTSTQGIDKLWEYWSCLPSLGSTFNTMDHTDPGSVLSSEAWGK